MRKLFCGGAMMLTLVSMVFIGSCKKSESLNIIEPITVVSPDSLDVKYVSKGQVYPVHIEFTTDRPIHFAKCMYELDTTTITNSFPDTLFYVVLDTIATKLTNKYSYEGTFTVPTNLKQQSQIKFDVQMLAMGNPSSPNYPNDTVNVHKQFKMELR